MRRCLNTHGYGKRRLKEMSDCIWSLPGLFGFMDEYYFGLDEKIDIYGSPLVMWNGGRPWGNVKASVCAETLLNFENLLIQYRRKNIRPFYTWSNWLLRDYHLKDPICNAFLEALWTLNEKEGGVIVASDILYDHIKWKYPRLQFKASVEKTEGRITAGYKGNIEWYRHLADKYDIVNIHQDDGFNDELLEALSVNADKYEILVNERCRRNCPYRRREHEIWSKMFIDKDFSIPRDKIDKEWYDRTVAMDCYCKPGARIVHPEEDCIFDKARFKKIYDLGYRRFKLAGRGWTTQEIIADCEKYMGWANEFAERKNG